ncbi:ribonuclease H, partial [Staphylococcus aureus]|nr:ribonuclease H [Staphylococcus aureus]
DFDLICVTWIPREQNTEANQHAQQAVYKLIKKNK